jgi:hypothetical protein
MPFYVSWRLVLPSALRIEEAEKKLEILRDRCARLPVERVSPALDVLRGEALEEERCRACIRWVPGDLELPVNPRPGENSEFIEATEVLSFVVWPGRGAESAWLGLARHPQADLRVQERTGGNWTGAGQSKTLYAAHPSVGGLQHFMKCHLALISALDEAKRLGFEVRVSDDGEYWQHRDVRLLLGKLHQAEHQVARIVGRLTDLLAGQSEGSLVAPMKGRPDFEGIEASPPHPVTPRWDGVVTELLRRTGGG